MFLADRCTFGEKEKETREEEEEEEEEPQSINAIKIRTLRISNSHG